MQNPAAAFVVVGFLVVVVGLVVVVVVVALVVGRLVVEVVLRDVTGFVVIRLTVVCGCAVVFFGAFATSSLIEFKRGNVPSPQLL